MSELKKCPFCGNEADISDGGYLGEKWLVRCISGRVDNNLPECPAAEGATYKTKEEAIKAWNRRESEVEESEVRNRICKKVDKFILPELPPNKCELREGKEVE